MLKGITWGQFGIFILLATAGYYLYIGVRSWGPGMISASGRRKSGAIGLKRVPGRAMEGKEGSGSSAAP